jgi:hypothetical protein
MRWAASGFSVIMSVCFCMLWFCSFSGGRRVGVVVSCFHVYLNSFAVSVFCICLCREWVERCRSGFRVRSVVIFCLRVWS